MIDGNEQHVSEQESISEEELLNPLLTLTSVNEETNSTADHETEIRESAVVNRIKNIIEIYTDQSGSCVNVSKGLSLVFLVGTLIGLVMPSNADLPNRWYQLVSSIVGYTYFVSWSVSFYPQIITNYQRKHISGLSTDSSILAVVNYTCYAIYNIFFYFDDSIRQEYKDRHGADAKITVQSNDVMFSIHALCLTCILFSQIAYYGGFRSSPISKITLMIVLLVLVVSFTFITCIYTRGWLWIDFLYLMAFFKLILTVLTYIPQVILNFWRQVSGQEVINISIIKSHSIDMNETKYSCIILYSPHQDGMFGM